MGARNPNKRTGLGRPAMSSEPLKFPPLKEVAFEIDFAPHLRVEDKIADFQDAIKTDFPNYIPEIVLRLPTGVRSPSRRREEQAVHPIKTHTFMSLDGQRTLKVSTVNLNLIVQQYLHFDDYLASASKCLDASIHTFQIGEILRIGLRYVNSITIERADGGFRVKKYVRSVLIDELENKADSFLVEITEIHDHKKLTVRSGLLPSEDAPGYREYLLDFDCYRDEKQTIGPIEKILLGFHDTIERRFHESVTEPYLRYMRTGEWPSPGS